MCMKDYLYLMSFMDQDMMAAIGAALAGSTIYLG